MILHSTTYGHEILCCFNILRKLVCVKTILLGMTNLFFNIRITFKIDLSSHPGH